MNWKMNLQGRLQRLSLEVLIVNLGESARLLSFLLNSVTTFFRNLDQWD